MQLYLLKYYIPNTVCGFICGYYFLMFCLGDVIMLFYIYFIIIFNGYTYDICKFPVQGLNLSFRCSNSESFNALPQAQDQTYTSAVTWAAAIGFFFFLMTFFFNGEKPFWIQTSLQISILRMETGGIWVTQSVSWLLSQQGNWKWVCL